MNKRSIGKILLKKTVGVWGISSFPVFMLGCSGIENPVFGNGPKVKMESSVPMSVVRIPSFSSGVMFGKGVNTYLGFVDLENQRSCVIADQTVPPPQFNGATVEMKIYQIKTSQELSDTINQNISVSLGAQAMKSGAKDVVDKILGISGEVSTKDSFFKKVTADKLFVKVSISKDFEFYNIPNAVMSEDDVNFFDSHPEQFMMKCGNGYVSGVRSAVRAEGVLECKSRSLDQKMSMESALKASIGAGGLTTQGAFSEAVERLQKLSNNECSFYFFSQGGQESSIDVSGDFQKFLVSAMDYVLKAPAEKAIPVEIVTSPYSTVSNNSFAERVYPKLNKYEYQASLLEMTKSTVESRIQRMIDIDNLFFYKADMTQDELNKWQAEKLKAANSAVNKSLFYYKCASQIWNVEACKL